MFFGAVVFGDGDAEDAVRAEARRETLDEAAAIEGLLPRAGKPGGLARHIGKECPRPQLQGDRGSAKGEAPELAAGAAAAAAGGRAEAGTGSGAD